MATDTAPIGCDECGADITGGQIGTDCYIWQLSEVMSIVCRSCHRRLMGQDTSHPELDTGAQTRLSL